MTRIAAVATALPEHVHPQQAISAMVAPLVSADPGRQALLRRLHDGAHVRTRHLVLPLDAYAAPMTFGRANDLFVELGTPLAARAAAAALERAGVAPGDVDLIVFTSVTGIAAPSVDALLVPILGLRDDVKRLPLFGLGCVAGASGIARVHDHLAGHPDEVALLVSVELCSLTVQHDDDSTDNLVASGLFGDGAAAVVLVGDRRAEGRQGPRVVASRSRLYPGTGDVIGFRPTDTGFRIALTAGVTGVLDRHFEQDARGFLRAQGVEVADVDHWIAHPGGPRVLEAFERALTLPPAALARSWASLAAVGNLSSASVLHVLAAELAAPHGPGATGLLFALGPGVSAELVLLRWPDAAPAAAAA